MIATIDLMFGAKLLRPQVYMDDRESVRELYNVVDFAKRKLVFTPAQINRTQSVKGAYDKTFSIKGYKVIQ